jgi:hypothetical protein
MRGIHGRTGDCSTVTTTEPGHTLGFLSAQPCRGSVQKRIGFPGVIPCRIALECSGPPWCSEAEKPCQGWGREFESRFPLQIIANPGPAGVFCLRHDPLAPCREFTRLGGRVVMQRPAKPCTPVRFRPQPPSLVSWVSGGLSCPNEIKPLGRYPPNRLWLLTFAAPDEVG